MLSRAWPLVFASVAIAAGCAPDRAIDSASRSTGAASPVVLRLAVFGDDELARAIDRLSGEWKDVSGGEIETVSFGRDVAPGALCAGSDLAIFPPRWLGELCEADLLRPMRPSVLRREELRFEDFLPAVRQAEIVYGNRVMALPVGCPTPLVLRTGEGPLAAPKGDIRLGLAFLAWSAPYAVHRSRVATLFDADDFRPRIADPPFVRALDELADAMAEGGATAGQVVWPQRSRELDSGESEPVVSRPPAAEQAFNPIAEAWEPLEASARFATLVASSGRLIGVTTETRNAAAAFRLAAWLAGTEHGPRLSTSGDGVANCRGSFARGRDAWVAEPRGLAAEFAEQNAVALRSSRILIAPRLPGAEEYLSVLGVKVRERLQGKGGSIDVLGGVAREWEAISARRGADAQQNAYLRSVNTADYEPGG